MNKSLSQEVQRNKIIILLKPNCCKIEAQMETESRRLPSLVRSHARESSQAVSASRQVDTAPAQFYHQFGQFTPVEPTLTSYLQLSQTVERSQNQEMTVSVTLPEPLQSFSWSFSLSENLTQQLHVRPELILELLFLSCCNSHGRPWWLSGKESAYQCRRLEFNPWVGMSNLEKEMATHSSSLAWEVPQTEEAVGLQFIGFQKSQI